MNHSGKRSLALLLAVCLLLGLLAGCGKKNNTQQLSANVYVPQYKDMNIDADYIGSSCSDGENLYFVAQKSEEVKSENPSAGEGEIDVYYRSIAHYSLYRLPLNGEGGAEKLSGYTGPSLPEGKDGSCSVDEFTVAEDGTFWVTESVYVWGDLGDYAYNTPAMPSTSDVLRVSDAAIDVGDVDIPVEEPGMSESYETIVRRHLDKDGNELECIDASGLDEALSSVLGEDEYINSRSFSPDGGLYVTTDSKLYALDAQMNILFSVEGENMWNTPIQLNGGLLGLQYWDYDETTQTSTQTLRTIDPAKQDWGTEYILPSNVYSIFAGGGDYLFYYQVNDAIFGFKAGEPDAEGKGTGEGERLFSWIEADINNEFVRDFFFLPDGRVAAILGEWDQNYERQSFSAVTMTSTPRSELPEKTTLVYASLYLGYDARDQIIDFNKKSDKYRIEVKDYSEFDTDSTGQASLQKLNTEILAGNVPDILDTTSLPLRQYGAKGILEDLWPMIDSDPDLSRDKLMIRPLEANQQDGKLYEIFSTFSIRTAIGPGKIVGNSMSCTLADLYAALEKMPEGCSIFGQSDTKENMLNTVVSLNMDQFVDWDKGECNFNSDGFKALLEFCNTFPAEFNWEDVDWEDWEEDDARIMTGKQLLYEYYLSDLGWDLSRMNAIFNNDVSYIGYPREDGGCGSSFSFSRGVAITTACQDKEGAWSFVRQALLPQIKDEEQTGRRYYGNFPINKADFDSMVESALTVEYETDENGERLLDENGDPIPVDYYGTLWINDNMPEVKMAAPTQADIDKVMALYDKIDSVYRYDEKIFESIKEVAGAYFAGDKTLDATAELIQSKVSLYVNENK